jgi:hypothetical protein
MLIYNITTRKANNDFIYFKGKFSGKIFYSKDGKLNNDKKHSYIYNFSSNVYYLNDKYHREDGPSFMPAEDNIFFGHNIYHIKGQAYSRLQFSITIFKQDNYEINI